MPITEFYMCLPNVKWLEQKDSGFITGSSCMMEAEIQVVKFTVFTHVHKSLKLKQN
jgi:hypothetical protein